MALGRHKDRQSELLVTWAEMPRSPGHAFYDRLQAELHSAEFDGFWVHRVLERESIESHVVDAASVLTADSDEGGHQFQSHRGHHSNLMAARPDHPRRSILLMSWSGNQGQAAARSLRRLSPLSSMRWAA